MFDQKLSLKTSYFYENSCILKFFNFHPYTYICVIFYDNLKSKSNYSLKNINFVFILLESKQRGFLFPSV